jgi:hypothetical protein
MKTKKTQKTKGKTPPPVEASLVGVRFDHGKVRHDLIPPEWDEVLAMILTLGAEKYAPRNWEKGMSYSRMIGSLKRHTNAYLSGEFLDTETGLPHLGHAAWNALALMSYHLRVKGEDDLPKADVAVALGALRGFFAASPMRGSE